jgi:hypothetical protein
MITQNSIYVNKEEYMITEQLREGKFIVKRRNSKENYTLRGMNGDGEWIEQKTVIVDYERANRYIADGYNIALQLASMPLVCIDIDHKEPIDYPLPDTYTEETQRGFHYFYRIPGSIGHYRGKTIDGIELKAAVRGNQNVNIAPSKGYTAKDRPIADAPQWVIDKICPTRKTDTQDTFWSNLVDSIAGTYDSTPGNDRAFIRHILERIDSDTDYETWYGIIRAVINVYGQEHRDEAIELLEVWSRQYADYNPVEFKAKIKSTEAGQYPDGIGAFINRVKEHIGFEEFEALKDEYIAYRKEQRAMANERTGLKVDDGDIAHTPSKAMYIERILGSQYHFKYDVMRDYIECNGQKLNSTLRSRIYHELRTKYNLSFQQEHAKDAMIAIAYDNMFDPVQDYFEQLPEYDGTDYIAQFVQSLNTNTPDAYEIVCCWLDNTFRKQHEATQGFMLVLAGGQGAGKGRTAKYLASGIERQFDNMFVECVINPESKDTDMYQSEYFIWEVSEFASSFRKKDTDIIKQVISRDVIRGTKKLSAETRKSNSRAGMIGSINVQDTGFLTDETGSRRFPVLECNNIDWEQFPDVDMLWSQIKHRHENGIAAPFMSRELTHKIQEANLKFQTVDDTAIYLEGAITDAPGNFLPTTEIIEYLRAKGVTTDNRKVSRALQIRKYEQKRQRIKGKYVRGYVGISLTDDTKEELW